MNMDIFFLLLQKTKKKRLGSNQTIQAENSDTGGHLIV